MNLKKDEVVKIFVEYGFDYNEKKSGKSFLTFTYKTGFFHNVEIVILSDNLDLTDETEIEKVERDFEDLGFSVKKNKYSCEKDIQKKLFDGFFETQIWKKNIQHEYQDFCNKVLDSLPGEKKIYSYIQSSFIKNDGFTQDTSIVDEIIDQLKKTGPSLILVEAPAGYGKTCTSYEIINSMAQSQDSSMPIPFFTEFSRDRQAVTFSHIFVKEVDRSFRVKSDLVINEVQKGRIAVILDGFDELLHETKQKKENAPTDAFESVEPMLETIGDLLKENAKIIITSRRSALFDSTSFFEWMQRRNECFNIVRYRINAPKISNWLPEPRINAISKTSLKLENLSNPVLLGYLRFAEDDEFSLLMETPFEMVDLYVKSMLERERDRQDLLMSADDQNIFLTKIAQDMSDNNYTSLPKDELVYKIKSLCSELLEKTRKIYPPGKKPTLDKLATTLSNHCFFDRGIDNSIQFVNEFVFGVYLSNCVMQSSDWTPYDERFLEPAVLVFQTRNENAKLDFWNRLETIKGIMDSSDRMRFELILKNTINEKAYDETEIKNVFLSDVNLFSSNSIEKAVFNGCKFKNCIFTLKNLINVTFLNCMFWDCTSHSEGYDALNNIDFYNCEDSNSGFIENIENLTQDYSETENLDVEKYILSDIFPLGSALNNAHFYWPKLIHTPKFTKKQVLNGLKNLKNNGFLEDAHNHDFMRINTSKYGEIKKILGRG